MNAQLLWLVGPYLLWLVIAVPAWWWLSRRLSGRWSRAAAFALLFAPSLIMLVYQAGVIGPAAPALLLYAVLTATGVFSMDGVLSAEFAGYVALWQLLPIGLTMAAYAAVHATRARLRMGRSVSSSVH